MAAMVDMESGVKMMARSISRPFSSVCEAGVHSNLNLVGVLGGQIVAELEELSGC